MSQPVPDRVIQPTRELVAAAAAAAAAIATQAATDAANNAVQLAKRAEDDANTVASDANHDANTATSYASYMTHTSAPTAKQLYTTAFDSATNTQTIAQNILDHHLVDFMTDVGETRIGDALDLVWTDIKNSAHDAITNAVDMVQRDASRLLQNAAQSFTDLKTAAQTVVMEAKDASDDALVAVAVTQTAVITGTLIQAVLGLSESLRPPDADTMANVIDAIADLAAGFTSGEVMTLTNSLAGLSAEADNKLDSVKSDLAKKATNLGVAVKPQVVMVRDAVKAAVAAALIPVKLPRPAGRDIFEPYSDTIDLDTIYQKITPESWLALSTPTYQEVYKIIRVVEAARSEYSLTAKTTSSYSRG